MANRRRTSRGGGGAGGFKGIVAAGAMILVAIAAVVGWWNYNGFKDLGDAIGWFQTKSANMDKCVNDRLNADNPDAQNILDANGCLIPNITGGGSGGEGQRGSTTLSPDSKSMTLSTLDAIAVKAPADVKYNRSEWKHWLDLDKDGCDTREQILKENGTDVKTDPKTCKVLSGTWVESYAGKEYTDPSSMDLDHVVPLSWAAANGGNDWDPATKANFANDPANLMLSDASENRSKGDKGPAEYLPPNTGSQCLYVNTFVFVVSKYNLSMSQLEKSAAQKVIDERC